MWIGQNTQLDHGKTIRFIIESDSSPLSYSEVLKLWTNDENFIDFFVDLLASVSFSAFRFETPQVTTSTVNQPFEFVVIDSPSLNTTPDQTAFAEYFRSTKQGSDVASFNNLGGDAILVVPCPVVKNSAYGHIGTFLRNAPRAQIHQLWRMIGESMEQRIGSKPVWLNTAGAGVAWLHVRLDDRPKYYHHKEYRNLTS
jgi:hypothetical protein